MKELDTSSTFLFLRLLPGEAASPPCSWVFPVSPPAPGVAPFRSYLPNDLMGEGATGSSEAWSLRSSPRARAGVRTGGTDPVFVWSPAPGAWRDRGGMDSQESVMTLSSVRSGLRTTQKPRRGRGWGPLVCRAERGFRAFLGNLARCQGLPTLAAAEDLRGAPRKTVPWDVILREPCSSSPRLGRGFHVKLPREAPRVLSPARERTINGRHRGGRGQGRG